MLLTLATKSLRNRLLTTSLTVASIAFSVALLVGVENVRTGMRESFAGTVRGVDLIVGARGGTIQLLLYSVFGIGSPTQNVSMATYERLREHPAVAWTIPYALGDSHRGFRVIGTNEDFFEYYRFREDGQVTFTEGRMPRDLYDVAIGSEVAERLAYRVGDLIEVTHGLSTAAGGIVNHDEQPFKVVGIMARTFTPIDRALYVTLEGVEAMHAGFETGAPAAMPGATPPAMPGATPPPMPGAMPPGGVPMAMPGAEPPPGMQAAPDGETLRALTRDDPRVRPTQLTAFFVGTKNRIETLQLKREIDTFQDEALSAIIPGFALGEMWRTIGYAESGLLAVTALVVAVGLLGMLVALYSSLNARRREMAILRAVGAGPRKIVSLMVLESGLLAALGAFIGVALTYMLLYAAQGPVERNFGLLLPIKSLGQTELWYLSLVVLAGVLIGFVPAYRAYRNTLTDGLSLRL
jgi:putative ABC transport system permease protein